MYGFSIWKYNQYELTEKAKPGTTDPEIATTTSNATSDSTTLISSSATGTSNYLHIIEYRSLMSTTKHRT